MFTGIIEELGIIVAIKKGNHSEVLKIEAEKIMEDIHIGDSIAVNGICLTVTNFSSNTFTVDVMHESINRSSLSKIRIGEKVNLERAMAANGRFGGHIVSGHVDGIGIISSIEKDDNAIWYTIRTESKLLNYIVEKGSITMDGISLTVAKVSLQDFSVSVIPHTAAVTTLSKKRIGDCINLETDIIGKYLEKLILKKDNITDNKTDTSNISMDFLVQNGF